MANFLGMGGVAMIILALAFTGLVRVIEADCDGGMCLTACSQNGLIGRCDATGSCECIFQQTCKQMELECAVACSRLKMDGSCNDQDECVCSITPEICIPLACEEQCNEDPRAHECLWVVPEWCMDYGPFHFCGCLCIQAQGKLGLKKKRKIGYRYNVTSVLSDNDL